MRCGRRLSEFYLMHAFPGKPARQFRTPGSAGARPCRCPCLNRKQLGPMKFIALFFSIMVAAFLNAHGSENMLTTIHQPLDPMADGSVVVREGPFVTGGAFPEVFFNAITQPHIPQQHTPSPVGDINVASSAGVPLSCESAASGQKKLHITWDSPRRIRSL